MQTFQQLILALNHYWDRQHCALLQSFDMEVGAGTFHTATFLRAIGPEPWNAAYVQPSRRPKDGRYGENPNRLQHYYQYQVVLKPSPANILDLYLGSLKEIGIDPLQHDIRFVEDDWEAPTLGAWGLGWEVWLNGMEVTQFTYFQEVGGIPCKPVMGEITYGLERLAMYLQGVESIFDLQWAPGVTYRDVYHQNEVEQSAYNFEYANVEILLQQFGQFESEAKRLFDAGLALPGYEMVMKCSHAFNLLDARGAISVTERAAYIGRVRTLARAAAQAYYQSRKVRGFERASDDAVQAFVSKEDLDEVKSIRAGLNEDLVLDIPKIVDNRATIRAPLDRSMSAPLLVELFTEELPPKALQRLGVAFGNGLRDALAASGLLADECKTEIFATPRRLAARLSNVLSKAPDRQTEERLLPEKVGFDAAGKPTAALLKKLATLGRDESAVASIKKSSDGKLVMLYLPQLAAGLTLQAGLSSALEKTIADLPIPKVMSYQLPNSTETVKFVRPAHGLVALHGSEVVKVQALGLHASRTTHGHRFLGTHDIELKNADEYEVRLRNEGKVIASFEARRTEIESQLKVNAAELGCTLGEYETLLDEVTALVEWPMVYVAGFDAEFLSVPQECLILTMRTNQKYFPLFSQAGTLTERFLVVSNMQVTDPVTIIEGNKRVVRPRLADARFFYDQDRKKKLIDRVEELGNVVYHNKLGSQLDRVNRIASLAGKIAHLIGADRGFAERAARLAKADLLTGMVGEFPELQGIMGRYYARHDGEPDVVADAIAEHYLPRFAGDRLPESPVACCVALADKLDTIIGIFGVGAIPTGDKDPFALRRHALGVIRILAECELQLHHYDLLKMAHETFPAGTLLASHDGTTPNPLKAGFFVDERAKSYLRDLGYSVLEIESVLDLRPRPLEYVSRLEAARKFLALPESAGLAEADKRIRNILSKSGGDAVVTKANDSMLAESEEKQLLRLTRLLRGQADALVTQAKFSEALLLTAQLHQPVTQFFDKVMVNVEDVALRNNRFALLHEVANLTNRVVNISKLAT